MTTRMMADDVASLFWGQGQGRAPSFELGGYTYHQLRLTAKQCAWLASLAGRERGLYSDNYTGGLADRQGREIGTWDLRVIRYGAGNFRVHLFAEDSRPTEVA